MAKKDQNIMLLQEVVGQLRKLNAGSVRDRLREAEEAKRAEQIALQGETQEEQQESIVSSTEDFRRRFIAGQAKTFTDSNITKTEEGKKNTERNKILKNISESLGGKTPGAEASGKALTNGYFLEGVTSINTSLSNISRLISSLLNQNNDWFNQQTRWRNDALRSAAEARREAINVNRPLGLPGTGARDPSTINMPDMNDGDAGFFDESTMGNIKAAAGLGIGAYLAKKYSAIKKWFGFGTKASFVTLMKGRFAAIAGKIFPKSRLGFVGPMPQSVKTNPRKWPFYLAAVIAGTFLAGGTDVLAATGEDGADGSVLPPDIPDLKDQRSGFEVSMDTTFAALGTTALLSKSTFVTNVAKTVGDKVAKAYSTAPKNSLRGRIYSNPGFQKGLKLGGRGLLRFLGPWGMAAWITWELVRWQMKKTEDVEAQGFAALQELNDIDDLGEVKAVFEDADLAKTFAKPMTAGDKSGQKLNKAKERIKNLLRGKSQDVQQAMINGLLDNGWTATELAPLLKNVNVGMGTGTDAMTGSNLKIEEKERDGILNGNPAGMSGMFNSGNTIVGDTHQTTNLFVSGYVQSAFESKSHHMAKGPR